MNNWLHFYPNILYPKVESLIKNSNIPEETEIEDEEKEKIKKYSCFIRILLKTRLKCINKDKLNDNNYKNMDISNSMANNILVRHHITRIK
jgi:hypothetical protein